MTNPRPATYAERWREVLPNPEGSRPSRWWKNGLAKRWPKVRPPWVKFGRIGVDQRRCNIGHSLDLHVAMLEQPLVVLFKQHGTDQPGDAGLVGEDADDIGAPLDLFVQPLQRVVLCSLVRCWGEKVM